MNDLDLLAGLRNEIPLTADPRVENAVLAQIAVSCGHAPGGKRPRVPLQRHGGVPRQSRGLPLRPVLVGTLAVAVGVSAYAGVRLSGSSSHQLTVGQTVAWSGQPTAPWPSTAHPSYGRATTAAQLIDYVTRAAAAMPGRAPKPNEWVAVKYEYAASSGGSGGYLFGPPDKRQISLQWFRGDGCAVAEVPPVPASTAPASVVTGRLTVSGYNGPGCSRGATIGGWQSVSYAYLDSLPTDPAALERILAGSAGPVDTPTREQAVFEATYELLDGGEAAGVVVPPKLNAALYQVLSQLPGVHFESATDLAGRQGLGFSMVLEGYLKQEIVIDPDTYTYMGFKDVAITDHALVGTDGTRYVKAGHIMGWGALLGSAIVGKPGQLP